MADPFVAEIRIFPFNFAPKGWAWCDGQLLPLSQNTALFSLLGTTYGGNGQSNFALPDLQGRAAMQPDQGPGLSLYNLGQSGGAESVTLLQTEIPTHNHTMQVSDIAGNSTTPAANAMAIGAKGTPMYAPISGATGTLSNNTITQNGGSMPHNNMQPYLTMYFAIAMQGVFPPRT
ncbi:phage tail protein [Undibacterium macrobrachii]|jgi:microcystin-dependent protein|uniref:Tail Collar domain-containing protein n=1 Tax=Undibacterium macrobrachii TaxID=1119058 RepID=A0ABQ2XP56_9BURK|nr:tail fiber protein [Undibacterium macrobrachii]GGX26739.1 tail Collar domain-containing protein [Undibacterium macrobrachii]